MKQSDTDLPNPDLAKDCCWIFKGNYTFQQWVERMEALHEKYRFHGFDQIISEVIDQKKKAQKSQENYKSWFPWMFK